MLKSLSILSLVMISLVCWSAQPVEAGKKDKGKHKQGYKHSEKYSHKYIEKYSYKYNDGNCKYKFKANRKGYKESLKCKHGVRHAGGPPPWAPAHGYRNQHGVTQSSYRPPFDIGLGGCNRGLIGTLIGAAGGGLAGSQIGKGDGKLVAVGAGVFLGAIIGGSIGGYMDDADQNCAGNVLEHAPDGETIAWNNPDGSQYQMTPVNSYQAQGGGYCREYTTAAVVGGRTQDVYGTACRQADGSWQLMN